MGEDAVSGKSMRLKIFGEFGLVARGHAEPSESGARPVFAARNAGGDVVGEIGL